jgi:hypothetical protein
MLLVMSVKNTSSAPSVLVLLMISGRVASEDPLVQYLQARDVTQT